MQIKCVYSAKKGLAHCSGKHPFSERGTGISSPWPWPSSWPHLQNPVTEESYPSNTPEIKAGEGGVRRKRAKVIYMLSKRTERLTNRPWSPSMRPAARPAFPVPTGT